MRFALLPCKPLAVAKSRLAPHVSDVDRRALCRAMFHDVLECLCQAQHVDRVAVVTADPSLLDLSQRMRALVIDEGRDCKPLTNQLPLHDSSPARRQVRSTDEGA